MHADFALLLRRFRSASGMTQEVLARRARLTAKFISQIENGHASPSIEVVGRLVEDGLELSLAAFFAGDPEVRNDLAQLDALLGSLPPEARRRALRVLKALCVDDAEH